MSLLAAEAQILLSENVLREKKRELELKTSHAFNARIEEFHTI